MARGASRRKNVEWPGRAGEGARASLGGVVQAARIPAPPRLAPTAGVPARAQGLAEGGRGDLGANALEPALRVAEVADPEAEANPRSKTARQEPAQEPGSPELLGARRQPGADDDRRGLERLRDARHAVEP